MSSSLASVRERFWEKFSLEDLTDTEWEALCDGCGRCCLQKLEDEDTGSVLVPDCLNVRPLDEDKLRWLPGSCAYKRLAEGRPLADWHPLISGDPQSVHRAGIGMAGRCVSEQQVPLHEWPHLTLFVVKLRHSWQ